MITAFILLMQKDCMWQERYGSNYLQNLAQDFTLDQTSQP